MLAATYARLGRMDDAAWEVDQVMTVKPDFTIRADLKIRGFRSKALEAHYAEGLRLAGFPE